MRLVHVLVLAASISACASTIALGRPEPASGPAVNESCASRDSSHLQWHAGAVPDAGELTRWCRAVGAPVFVTAATPTPPPLDEVVLVSWNAHLAEGELRELIATLQSGALTAGRPVDHFVLLVQELFRRGDAVPAFDDRDRSAFAIHSHDPDALDVDDYAAKLGLSIMYVPSMRNGRELREDRGNAIISTEPLLDPFALELPLARQRRVALGAAIDVMTSSGPRRLEFIDAHLEPLSSPKTLWVFTDPRASQVRAILDLVDGPRYANSERLAGVVIGGDFNTVRGGAGEPAYRLARAWSQSLKNEDPRNTHLMGRLDYIFARLQSGWTMSTRRLDQRFGSDHYPVVGMFDASR